tara:strand:+ start:217 stop:405 length:189 start_codon:yes stop_codon:yes gene_type:complete
VRIIQQAVNDAGEMLPTKKKCLWFDITWDIIFTIALISHRQKTWSRKEGTFILLVMVNLYIE